MLSLPKLLALGGIVWGVFYLFRMMERRRNSARDNIGNDTGTNNSNNANGPAQDNKPSSLDLEECSLCGAWVAGQPCDRDECPYKG